MKIPILAALLLALPAVAASPPLTIPLLNSEGSSIGEARLSPLRQGVKIELSAKGLSPGLHAIHFHEKGSCEPPSFTSAGPHFSPESREHGFDSAQGPHAGDLPNILVREDGSVQAELVSPGVTLTQKSKNSLRKPGGTALIIHAGTDDYRSQPAGNAGDRLACGKIPSP
ncbi:MAG: superoxide dismutase family protein [Oligoflexia bacterium]|nr:superoxide dismutase family protein [Oligoflexia bacterium]